MGPVEGWFLHDFISFKLLSGYILYFDFCEIQHDAPVIVQPLIPSSPVHVPAYPSQQTYVQPSAPGNLFNPWIEILFSTQLLFKLKKNSARISSPDSYSSNAINSKLHQVLRLLKWFLSFYTLVRIYI